MRLLVSLCSRTAELPAALVVVDPQKGSVSPVELLDPGEGAFGLVVAGQTIYCVLDRGRPRSDEPERSELVALDAATFEPRWRREFTLARDVHSMVVDDGVLYAVSTGTDEVVALTLGEDGAVGDERRVWRPEAAGIRSDDHHLNAVEIVGGQLLVSGFGRRPYGTTDWREARGGFVRDVGNGALVFGPIYHPHSICELDGRELGVCASPARQVVTTNGRVSSALPGYARGLCYAAESLYVGTSRGRKPNEPASILSYPQGFGGGECAVCRLDLSTLQIEDVTSLAAYGREVYEIVGLQ